MTWRRPTTGRREVQRHDHGDAGRAGDRLGAGRRHRPLVDTPLPASWTAVQDHRRDNSPIRRAAQPADVADLASSLIGDRYLTGEVIVLDGGMNLR